MEDSDIKRLQDNIRSSASPVSRWFGGMPVQARNNSITALFTIRKEMTDERDIARASILSAIAEETAAMFKAYHNKSAMDVQDLCIHQISPVAISDSFLVRMHLIHHKNLCQLRFRLIGEKRRTLAWGAINCVCEMT